LLGEFLQIKRLTIFLGKWLIGLDLVIVLVGVVSLVFVFEPLQATHFGELFNDFWIEFAKSRADETLSLAAVPFFSHSECFSGCINESLLPSFSL
jgi:hypothetical protein